MGTYLYDVFKISKSWSGLVFREIVFVCASYTPTSNTYWSGPSARNEINPRCQCPTCPTTISVGIGKGCRVRILAKKWGGRIWYHHMICL